MDVEYLFHEIREIRNHHSDIIDSAHQIACTGIGQQPHDKFAKIRDCSLSDLVLIWPPWRQSSIR